MSAQRLDGAAVLARLGDEEVAALEALLWMVEAVGGVHRCPPTPPQPLES